MSAENHPPQLVAQDLCGGRVDFTTKPLREVEEILLLAFFGRYAILDQFQ